MPEISIAEQSARAVALGRYARFLLKRYQRLELIEIGEADPINLRQIFVSMRVGPEDLPEDAMGKRSQEVADEPLPGEDAWDLLIREPLVILSGRPGSGKTTLVQEVVAELCNDDLPSRLRKETQAVPIPLMLRHVPDLETVGDLDDLLTRWWPLQAEQAEHDKLPLDLPRLQAEIIGDGYRALGDVAVLLLFDGIDEVGGPHLRQRLLDLAFEAAACGFSVLVTGRPAGLVDLAGPRTAAGDTRGPLKLHYLLPFAWEQIANFLDRWYRLRDEWARKRREGVALFLGQLADRSRDYLLTLARRPIFLTLMALVHTTQNQMPEGRPLLYQRIVDLYLERQERHRQRQQTVHGAPMPHWPPAELRLVLGNLASLSQSRGGALHALAEPEAFELRRVVWDRRDMERAIRSQLDDKTRQLGRFATLRPKHAEKLLDYFLYPAGLLVEPEEGKIQFAHLSFQEYLCAWFLYERAKVMGLRRYLEDRLFKRLAVPGWDEVAILLLRIRADDTGQEGHFELLSWLDLADPPQAAVFVAAVTGRELPFTASERLLYLPPVVGCALAHPHLELSSLLAKVAEWREDGLNLVMKLLEAGDDKQAWSCIERARRPEEIGLDRLAARWLEPSSRDLGLRQWFGPVEARAQSLLQLLNLSGWVEALSPLEPIANAEIEVRLTEWLGSRLRSDPALLWALEEGANDTTEGSAPTNCARELDALLPNRGALWQRAAAALPADAMLDPRPPLSSFETPAISLLFATYPAEAVVPRIRLGLLLRQIVLSIAGATGHRHLLKWQQSASRPPLRQSRTERLQLRYVALASSLAPRLGSIWFQWSDHLLPFISEIEPHLSIQVSRATNESLENLLEVVRQVLSQRTYREMENQLSSVSGSFVRLVSRFEALAWFQELRDFPDLRARRGLSPDEPLFRGLGLLDEEGSLLPEHPRDAWASLGQRLAHDESILDSAFADGLDANLREILLADLAIVRRHPWSPQSGIAALLADWPADEPARPYTLEAADLALRTACEAALPDLEARWGKLLRKRTARR